MSRLRAACLGIPQAERYTPLAICCNRPALVETPFARKAVIQMWARLGLTEFDRLGAMKTGSGVDVLPTEAGTDRIGGSGPVVTRDARSGVVGLGEVRRLLAAGEPFMGVGPALVTLIATVRPHQDEHLSHRDVRARARRRRRRLGLLALGAGPLAGVATRLTSLYCEVVTLRDVAVAHGRRLTDHEMAAELLVLWSLAPDRHLAAQMLQPDAETTLAVALAARLHEQASEHLPPSPTTKRGALEMIWAARKAVGDAREFASSRSLRGILFAGIHAKRFITRAEAQLAVPDHG